MNPTDRCESGGPLTEIEELLTADQRRRPITVAEHQAFRESISTPRYDDEIDAAIDEHLEIDPYVTGTNNRRSDKELAKMLDIIDNLPISTNRTDGQA